MTYETVPATSDGGDETACYGDVSDEFPGVKVTVRSGAGRHDQGPINIAGHHWKRSTLQIYPGTVVPGVYGEETEGWYVTGEVVSDEMATCSMFEVFDAQSHESATATLGSDVMFVPVMSGYMNPSLSEYAVTDWDGGNRQDG